HEAVELCELRVVASGEIAKREVTRQSSREDGVPTDGRHQRRDGNDRQVQPPEEDNGIQSELLLALREIREWARSQFSASAAPRQGAPQSLLRQLVGAINAP